MSGSGLMPPHVLAYVGDVAVPYINRTFPPNSTNNQFNVPTIWTDTAGQNSYILVAKPQGVADWIILGGSAGSVTNLEGNTGGVVSPTAGIINVIGDGTTMTFSGSGSTLTGSVIGTIPQTFTSDSGVATPSAGNLNILGGSGVTTAGSGATITINASSTTPTSFVTDSGTAVPSSNVLHVSGGTNIATSGSGSSVTISYSGASPGTTITGNSGGALSPTAGNWNIVGSGSITTAGSGSTLTAQLTGLTNHALLVGAGSTTITKVGPSSTTGQVLQSQGSSADPAFSTATYPSTTTANQILYSSSSNVVGQITAANNSTLITNASGVPSLASMATNGGLLIGSGAGLPVVGTLTAGTGVTITNGANSIQISSSGSGLTWNNVTGTSSSMSVSNGYVSNNASLVSLSLPTSSVFGDVISIVGQGAGGWRITQGSGQQVIVGLNSSTLGASGHVDSSNRYDTITLLCTVANTIWTRIASNGSIGTT